MWELTIHVQLKEGARLWETEKDPGPGGARARLWDMAQSLAGLPWLQAGKPILVYKQVALEYYMVNQISCNLVMPTDE